jgi:hypothetical protein
LVWYVSSDIITTWGGSFSVESAKKRNCNEKRARKSESTKKKELEKSESAKKQKRKEKEKE